MTACQSQVTDTQQAIRFFKGHQTFGLLSSRQVGKQVTGISKTRRQSVSVHLCHI